MWKMIVGLGLGLGLLMLPAGAQMASPPPAPAGADAAILATVRNLRAIDDHAHPPALSVNGVADTDYDALPCPPEDPIPPTLASRADNPIFQQAWRALYGASTAQAELAAKALVKQQQELNYPNWVLDKLGIETELANRVAMGPGLAPPRFRWVAFDDALLLPLATSALAVNPDRTFFFGREAGILRRYYSGLRLGGRPATLDDYLRQVVVPTIERQKAAGAVAIKFEAAYLRPLNFRNPDLATARAVYAAGGAPAAARYYPLQDAIFHAIALEAGRLGLAVHFHTGFGCGSYFDITGANPALLMDVFNDPTLRHTNFVLLHAGLGPYVNIVAALIAKPNIYTDISGQTWLLPPAEIARVVRTLLEYYPDKVMFGTDLSPGAGAEDWEEIGYQMENAARDGLALALSGMLRDGEVTRPQALAIARNVLRGTALRLYPELGGR
ncbi:MAG: amidohydrolase family protein [Terriglobales bacterium]